MGTVNSRNIFLTHVLKEIARRFSKYEFMMYFSLFTKYTENMRIAQFSYLQLAKSKVKFIILST